MKVTRLFESTAALLALLGMSVVAAPAAKTTTPGAAATPVSDPHQWDIPQSVFQIPSSPKDGRDPFFPNAILGAKPPTKVKETPVIDPSGFVLNGITSPPKRTAMINGRTFEPGESGEVKLPGGGRILIKCVEIKNESAIIEVAGQRQELKMRFGV